MAIFSTRRIKRFLNQHPIKSLGAVLLVAALVLAILELTNITHLFHESSVPPVIPVTTNNSSANSSNHNDQNNPDSNSDKSSSSPSGSSKHVNLPLYAPYGDFVSNHHPNLGGSPAPSQETSVCNTTPGAKCTIRFTKGSVTTSLPSQITDSKGTTYWNWDVKTAGLTAGNWTITAAATLNGQTKTTQDPLPLSVAP